MNKWKTEVLPSGLIRFYDYPDINFYLTQDKLERIEDIFKESVTLSEFFYLISPECDRVISDNEFPPDHLDKIKDFLWSEMVNDGKIIGLTYYSMNYGIYFMVDPEFIKVMDDEMG